jgi:DNA-binding transcriptional ArsR family regulator
MPPSSSELIDAVRHPTRRRILRAYLDDSPDCVAASQLAAALERPVGQVDYHLRTLERLEILRLVHGRGLGAEPAYGWALNVEAEWLQLVLDVWAESELPR